MAELVVALDVPEFDRAHALVRALAPLGVTFKVGYESFYGYGAQITGALEARGASYCLDLKLNDIPRTAAAAVRALVKPGVRMLTLHALGGSDMMVSAVEAAAEQSAALGVPEPELLAVTILTSIGGEEFNELGLTGGPGENVIRLAALARDARCAGIVCSAREAGDVKHYFGTGFKTLCPGIRPAGSSGDDQRRTTTPAQALAAGVDYIVVGRPITESADPVAAVRAILDEIGTPAHT